MAHDRTVLPNAIRKESDELTISEADCPLGTYAHGMLIYTTPVRSSYYCIVCLKTGPATRNQNGTFTLGDAAT